MSKPVKVTICPPAEQDVFFQEMQFDPELPGRGSHQGMTEGGERGTDPIAFCIKKQKNQKTSKAPSYGAKVKKTRLKKAKIALKGHENEEEILKILRTE